MDYKESISFTARSTLTAGAKRELARDVSALANAQGGLLVIGVKNPEWEGEPPTAEDLVGVAVPETFARDLESSLLGSVSPPLYPFVRVTEDDFEHPQSGERRRLVELLVAGIRVGRKGDGSPKIEITYRFGPPSVATAEREEEMFVGSAQNTLS
jgi:hypothetical protein